MFSAATKTDGSTTANYIEDVFSTYLYTGTGSSQTITNGINLSGKGGLVWIKSRSGSANNVLVDTVRGPNANISSNLTTQSRGAFTVTAFSSSGFTVTNDTSDAVFQNTTGVNGTTYASWTFREQDRFFDARSISHTNGTATNVDLSNLGTLGMVIVKITNTTGNWIVWHRSLTGTNRLQLNTTAAQAVNTVLTISGTTATITSGAVSGTYIMYAFAHDAGGFGLTGSDNVISCGAFTTPASGTVTVSVGFEPQWLLIKKYSGTDSWFLVDNVRALGVGNDARLFSDLATSEDITVSVAELTPTGFISGASLNLSSDYIYMAIRRGPMKTPTTGTSVFQPVVYTGTNVDNRLVNTSIFTDFIMARQRNSTTLAGMLVGDRLRANQYWLTNSSAIGVTDADSLMTPTLGYGNSFSAMNGFGCGNDATAQLNVSTVASNQVVEAFARAPGFLDVVTYTGTGATTAFSHNLGVTPEMMWIKRLTVSSDNPIAYVAPSVAQATLNINGTGELLSNPTAFNNTQPTSTQFTVGTSVAVNASGSAYVAYLMASVPGVSKCSYYVGRGVGTSQQVDCGFASGARFILIKSLGVLASWFLYDTARGIIAGNDPYVLLDSNAAEVTSTDYIDSYSSGFEVSTTAPSDLNRGYAQDWVGQAAVGGTSNMNDVLYANGLWVVGASNTNVYYGATGYSWTTATGVVTGGVNGLAFGNNLYVAVGPSGRISTSSDLITWTPRTSGVIVALNGATYGFGKYWVCGDSGTLLSSSDGITWSTVSLGTTADLYRVRFVNGVLIIVGQTGTIITSADGTTFTTRTTGVTTQLRDVTFGNSTYVTVGSGGTIITSTDLATWTTRSAGSLAGNVIYGVTYAGYRFIAVASAGETAYSSDGITWSTGAGAGGVVLYSVAYGNDIVVVGNGDGDVYLSDMRYWYWAIA